MSPVDSMFLIASQVIKENHATPYVVTLTKVYKRSRAIGRASIFGGRVAGDQVDQEVSKF